MVGGAPSQRLDGQGRVARSAGSEDATAKQAQIGDLMGKSPSVNDARFGIVAHASAAVGVGAKARPRWIALGDGNRSGGFEPLLHFVLRVEARLAFVFLGAARDADHRIA